jgi:SPP1 gp7 family putative phage head morphogenesis protein
MRILDRWEREFLAAVRKLLAARVKALEPVVKAALEPGGEKVIEKLGRLRALPGDYLPLLERYVGHLLVEGMVQGRSDVEFLRSRLQRRGVRLAARVDGEPVVPEEAIAFIRHRRDLGRFFEQDQVDTVRTILDNGLKEGATVKQVMDALRIALPEAIGKARAENIARTEATTAFNQGRLAAFRETKGFVGAVEFMAITDARTTPICMERDGLVLAIDDPRLPDNTPPLHYMCRSVLSPVSEFELEDLGGQAYLDKQRDKLEKLPAPLKGFGNEPGLDGGRPPGQPPVVRTPRGPKGGEVGAGEAGSAETQRQHSKVDLLPAQATPGGGPAASIAPGKPWAPKEKEHIQHPSGLRVYEHPGAGQGSGVANRVLQVIGGLPQGVRDTLHKGGVRAWFVDEASLLSLGRRPSGMRTKRWQRELEGIAKRGAGTLTDYPRLGEVTMVFVTDRLAFRKASAVAHAARHETWHALHRSITRKGPRKQRRALRNALREAFEKRSSLLPKSFHTSPAEHLAEGFDWRHGDNLAHAIGIQVLAPTLSGIVGSSSEVLALMESLEVDLWEKAGCTVLYFGPEGFAVKGPDSDEILFSLNLGNGQEGETLCPDGTILTHGGGCKKVGGIHISWPEFKTWTPEEAEPYKAFLRSKGVTLPHVMS